MTFFTWQYRFWKICACVYMRCPKLDEWSIIEHSKHASSFAVSIPFSSIGSPTLHAAVKVITVHLSETQALYDDELQPLWVLLFRHSTKSLNAHEERMATSPYLVTRLHVPHAITVMLHVRQISVVILAPETAGSLSV